MSTAQLLADSLNVELLEVVVDRRGSFLLKVQRGDDVMALKGVDSSVADTYDRAALVLHEAEILRELDVLVGNQYVDHGTLPEFGAWLLKRWVEGDAATDVAAKLRDRPLTLAQMLDGMTDLFTRIVAAYVPIHDAGILHGDVQPRHILLEPGVDRPVILDWGLARRTDERNAPYKGGLVHYAAPEVARDMLADLDEIPYGVAAEVYSLGAMLYFCATGDTAVDYGPGAMSQIPFELKLKAVAQGNLRGFTKPRNHREAALQEAIAGCLVSDPTERTQSAQALLDAVLRASS